MADSCCDEPDALRDLARRHRSVLLAVFAINAALFGVELGSGLLAGSSALVGDSLDMLGDALVYGASLYVVGRSARAQAGVAAAKGLVMGALGVAVIAGSALRLAAGAPPVFEIMGVVGALALAGNTVCFALLYRHRADNLNFRSVWLCSRNDLVANVAVLAAALAVAATRSPWPDALVGAALAALWLRSSVRVLREASAELRESRVGVAP
jgi:Co/Zn/Cd efflux system component